MKPHEVLSVRSRPGTPHGGRPSHPIYALLDSPANVLGVVSSDAVETTLERGR